MECPAKAFLVRQMLGRKNENKHHPTPLLTTHPPSLCCRDATERKTRTETIEDQFQFWIDTIPHKKKKCRGVCLRIKGGYNFQWKPPINSWSLKKEQAHFLLWWLYKPRPIRTFSFEGRGRGRSMQRTESRVKEWRNNWQLQHWVLLPLTCKWLTGLAQNFFSFPTSKLYDQNTDLHDSGAALVKWCWNV